ncbi:uncharacterized protein [Euwallacea fornicatus]|uniref:uncharacterized protein n=1 Tax=Euwallacea fornicatus TaxID=995702 RepID=UPI00338F1150
MAFELILLGALIFIFIISFCGLLQKIKQTYDRERLIAERIARHRADTRRISTESFTEIYVNPAFNNSSNGGVFPTAPPPYSLFYSEAPPQYDEVVKVHRANVSSVESELSPEPETVSDTGPPPYTINLTLVTEATNRPQ